MKPTKNRLEKLETQAREKNTRDIAFYERYAEAYAKYNHLPEDKQPDQWRRVQELVGIAQERKHELEKSYCKT